VKLGHQDEIMKTRRRLAEEKAAIAQLAREAALQESELVSAQLNKVPLALLGP
jgi:hypothetical protein